MNSFLFTMVSVAGKGYRYQGVKGFLKKAKVIPWRGGLLRFIPERVDAALAV